MVAQQQNTIPTASPARVWVIAGASRGIGEQYVAQVLKSGDAVVAAARRPEKAQGLAKLKEQHGDALQIVKLDLDDHASIKAAAEEVSREHPGGIDFLIVNAAISGAYTIGIETDPADMERVLGTNVVGAFATIQAFYPLLKKKVDGVKAVVTISSLAGAMGAASESARALDKPAGALDNAVLAYKVSKTALNQVTVQLANELKGEGFTVMAMHPGVVATDMFHSFVNSGEGLADMFKPLSISPEQSVSDQLAFLATASQGRDNGRFVDNLGNAMDW